VKPRAAKGKHKLALIITNQRILVPISETRALTLFLRRVRIAGLVRYQHVWGNVWKKTEFLDLVTEDARKERGGATWFAVRIELARD